MEFNLRHGKTRQCARLVGPASGFATDAQETQLSVDLISTLY